MPWPPIRYATWPLDGEWEDHAVFRAAEDRTRDTAAPTSAHAPRLAHYGVVITSCTATGTQGVSVGNFIHADAQSVRVETADPPAGALDNASPPCIVDGMRCPGCKRKHTVEVVYGSVTHVTHKWNRAVYTCVCCEWSDVKGQR